LYLIGGDANGSVESKDLTNLDAASTDLGTLGIHPITAVKMANDKVLVLGPSDAGTVNPNPPYFDSVTGLNADSLHRSGATAPSISMCLRTSRRTRMKVVQRSK